MQWLMKICARGALGLGAAALLLSGVPAHANPAAGAASRKVNRAFWLRVRPSQGKPRSWNNNA